MFQQFGFVPTAYTDPEACNSAGAVLSCSQLHRTENLYDKEIVMENRACATYATVLTVL